MHQLSSTAVTTTPIAIGETLAGKYRIERVLGEGGMGVVMAAHHLELDQPVAIKFLLESVAEHEEGAERFRREARAAAKIQSDHVVRVLDVGLLESGERYMVMEYLQGRDLAEELQERGAFPIHVACGFILEAIDAVGQAHAVGIVHRDLKPANLFLARRSDGSQRIKVLDFGISKTIGASTTEQLSLTKTSAWIGSPLYMAPEQMQSARDVDARADVWSLGAILYELITGVPPYEAESLPQLCNLLITTDAPSIQLRNPAVPDDLAQAIMMCLVRDKDQRVQNIYDLVPVLGRYAAPTGGGVRNSLLDRTELAGAALSSMPSLPGQSLPGHSLPGSVLPGGTIPGGAPSSFSGPLSGSPLSGASTASTQLPLTGAETIHSVANPGTTHAAWGHTGSGEKKSKGGLWALLAAAVVIAGGAGAFLFGGGSTETPVPESSMVAAPAADVVPAMPEPEKAAAEDNTAAAEQADTVAADTVAEQAAPEQTAAPAPAQAPAPVQAPAPRPVVAPRPAARPAPGPAPAPATSDEFSDFGGRR